MDKYQKQMKDAQEKAERDALIINENKKEINKNELLKNINYTFYLGKYL